MTLQPRLDPNEVEYLSQFMANKAPDTKMVEWGSGGSTLMFLPHFETGKFISIEHNREWYDKVNDAIELIPFSAKVIGNFTYCWRPPSHDNKHVDLRFYGYGVPYEENPCFAANYINPEASGVKVFDADVFFVDGICRGAILATIRAIASNPSATVFIHDYYGGEKREDWYNWASGLYKRVEKVGDTLARLYL